MSPVKLPDITDENLKQIERMAGLGLTREAIAHVLGFSGRTLRNRMTKDIERAMRRGMAKAELIVGTALFKRCEAGDMRAIKWWEMTRAGRSARAILQQASFDVASLSDEQIERLLAGEDPLRVVGAPTR